MQGAQVLLGAELADLVHPVARQGGRTDHQGGQGAAARRLGPGVLLRSADDNSGFKNTLSAQYPLWYFQWVYTRAFPRSLSINDPTALHQASGRWCCCT